MFAADQPVLNTLNNSWHGTDLISRRTPFNNPSSSARASVCLSDFTGVLSVECQPSTSNTVLNSAVISKCKGRRGHRSFAAQLASAYDFDGCTRGCI